MLCTSCIVFYAHGSYRHFGLLSVNNLLLYTRYGQAKWNGKACSVVNVLCLLAIIVSPVLLFTKKIIVINTRIVVVGELPKSIIAALLLVMSHDVTHFS
jgi:hypothetical protein